MRTSAVEGVGKGMMGVTRRIHIYMRPVFKEFYKSTLRLQFRQEGVAGNGLSLFS